MCIVHRTVQCVEKWVDRCILGINHYASREECESICLERGKRSEQLIGFHLSTVPTH